jgi:hypothetical protein
MADLVYCHSGSQYAEYPLSFHFQGQPLPVDEILARARTPAGSIFRVRAARAIFDLTYDELQDQWSVVQLTAALPISPNPQEPA